MIKSVRVTITGGARGVTLGALRELVAAAEGMPDTAPVSVNVDLGHGPLDPGGSTISITRTTTDEGARP